MVILNNSDMFQVRLATLVADYDQMTITNLYQPLVGHSSIALYFTLIGEANLQKVNPIASHESLLAKMQMSVGDFTKARKALEGAGLLRTYLEDNNGARIYHYEIYAPKTPDEFFNDTLLYGLLINYVGESDAKKLNQYYATSTNVIGKEISASFKEIFHPDFESKSFIKALNSNPSMGRNRAQMKLEFDYARFFESLKEVSQISDKAFSKAELSEISRLASLNGIDENVAAHIVADYYDPNLEKGNRIDLKKVTKAFQEETSYSYLSSFNKNKGTSKPHLVSSNTAISQKVKLVESVTPKDFLAYLQGGGEPAISDLKIVDYLSKKYHLNNGVLNVVIDYALLKNDNVLTRAYCEKICASLSRSGIDNALDAMNYFIKTNKKNNSHYEEENISITPKVKKEVKSNKENNEVDPEWDELMQELEDMEDKNDGKA